MRYRAVSDASHFDTKTSIVDENNRIVAQVVDERQAQLIAAAPELLEACKEAEKYCALPFNQIDGAKAQKIVNICRAAIAKAEGRG